MRVARVLTSLDQLFTHHFDVLDTYQRPVLRLTRPAKIFRSRVHAFAAALVVDLALKQDSRGIS
jgi:hypothetical protein